MKMNETVNLDFVRWSAAFAVAAFCVTSAFADDVYSAVPDDPSQVVVTNNTTTVGLDLYRDHLKQYWKFDDATDKFTNSVGTVTLSAYSGTPVYTNDAKIGGGALFMNGGIKASENVLDGKKPFTIMFWTKRPKWTVNQHSLVHVGKQLPNGGAMIQDVNNYIRLSYGNEINGGYSKFYFWENHIENASGAANTNIGTADFWNHVALRCDTVESKDAVTSNNYSVVVNGVLYKSIYAPQTDFRPDDHLLFGYGWHYGEGPRSGGNMFIDEIMIFDKVLNTTDINKIKDFTQPFDFSANWHMTKGSGTLDIPGSATQNVTGYGGTVNTDEGLVLAPERNTTYAGIVSGASLTLDAASSSVTQTIAGVNTYSGETRVKKGVLAVNPMAAFPTLETSLIAYWPCDTLSASGRLVDMSGNGNDLGPSVRLGDASIVSSSCVADGALDLPQTGAETNGFTRVGGTGRLEGFTDGDNSFTVSFWIRPDSVTYREGPISFSSSSGARFNNSSKAVVFGDANHMGKFDIKDGTFGDGKWRHFAFAYDKTKANGTDDCYFLYTNGYLAVATSDYNPQLNHASQKFCFGTSLLGGEKRGMDGSIDDVVVLNGASDADVAKLYSWRRGSHTADGDTTVLPDTTRVVVDAGATLFITNANESERSIAGAGTIHIAEGSSLYAKSRKDFTGTITGGGTFRSPGLSMVIR